MVSLRFWPVRPISLCCVRIVVCASADTIEKATAKEHSAHAAKERNIVINIPEFLRYGERSIGIAK
jgi:hypothetical protein